MPQRYERIAERLAADIRAGRLAPGERLPGERELARRLEVGRASVREAIAALALRGVLATRPGAGSYVADDALERLAPGEVGAHDAGPFDLLEARLLLEPGVAALAARRGRRDPEAERAARRDGRRRGRARPRGLERRRPPLPPPARRADRQPGPRSASPTTSPR